MLPIAVKLRASKWAAALFVAIVASSAASVAVALSCMEDNLETLTLELERVEVDSQEQSDLAAYEQLDFRIRAWSADAIEVDVSNRRGSVMYSEFRREDSSDE